MIRLGLVGVGKIARDQHLPAIAVDPHFELLATASPSGSIDDIPRFRSMAAMLADGPQLDAVVLCTPPGIRPDLCRLALDAGLHVMLEKPPAVTTSDVDAMRSTATARGRSLFATWHSRETAAVDAAATWLATRQVLAVNVIWREDIRVWHPGQDWLLAAGGFGVFDPTINAFSILTHILPGSLALEEAELGIPENRGEPVVASLLMRHGGTAPVRCDVSIVHAGEQRWDIIVTTDDGELRLTDGGHTLRICGDRLAVDATGEYPRLYTRFAGLIDAGGSDVDVRPLVLVERAMALGKVTTLPPFHF